MEEPSRQQEPPFRRVLVIEDDPVLSRILARNLARRGVEVQVAASAEAALDLLSAWQPDLLVLDLELPGRTGWEVVRQLRASGRQIPVVIVTGGPLPMRRIAEFQPLAVLRKPFPLEAFLRLVQGDREGEESSEF
ncbi:MAG: response regulator [Thermomicrobium sp.]|nr:response regulator [Thermomicrobium sp.]MDW8007802.1 response regulator [Thermomicrobium sp.]